MADLPMAQLPQFGVNQPGVPYMGNMGTGAASGFQQGMQTYQNQVALQQQQQALQQKQHQDEVMNALTLMSNTGAQLQYLRPDSQKLAISNSLNALSKVAPEFGIQPHTPDQIPDESIDLVKSFNKLHEGLMNGKLPLATYQSEGSNLLGEMSQFERDMVSKNSNILGTPKLEPGQINGQSVNFNPDTGQSSSQETGQPVPGNFVPNATIAREQNARQMGAASAASPYISQLASYHTIQGALQRNDQIGDRTAIMEAGKFLGETPEEMQKLAKSGFFGDNIAQYAEKGFGTSDMTTKQRADFNSVIGLHMQGLQKAAGVQAEMYQGVSGPNLSTESPTPAVQPITRTLKSGKTAESTDGGKTWFYKQ